MLLLFFDIVVDGVFDDDWDMLFSVFVFVVDLAGGLKSSNLVVAFFSTGAILISEGPTLSEARLTMFANSAIKKDGGSADWDILCLFVFVVVDSAGCFVFIWSHPISGRGLLNHHPIVII